MITSEIYLKISSALIELENELLMDSDYNIQLQGQVVKVEDKTNNDGTVTKVFTIRPYLVQFQNEQEQTSD
jgi:hypothetical protein